jgi:hypothetical protein
MAMLGFNDISDIDQVRPMLLRVSSSPRPTPPTLALLLHLPMLLRWLLLLTGRTAR